MLAQPQWSDSEQGDLLELVAMGSATGTADAEWTDFLLALHVASTNDGLIDPNAVREHLRGRIAPRRIGAFYSRAVAQDILAPTGEWVISDDVQGKNSGRPCRTYWLVEQRQAAVSIASLRGIYSGGAS